MTYWDSILAVLTALTSPAAVQVYLFLSMCLAVFALIAACTERGYWSDSQPARWRKPAWCRVVFVLVGPYILLAACAMIWIASFVTDPPNTWP